MLLVYQRKSINSLPTLPAFENLVYLHTARFLPRQLSYLVSSICYIFDIRHSTCSIVVVLLGRTPSLATQFHLPHINPAYFFYTFLPPPHHTTSHHITLSSKLVLPHSHLVCVSSSIFPQNTFSLASRQQEPNVTREAPHHLACHCSFILSVTQPRRYVSPRSLL